MRISLNPQIVITNETLLRWAGFRIITRENCCVEMPLSTWLYCIWCQLRRKAA